MKCYICQAEEVVDISQEWQEENARGYKCPRCGRVDFTEELASMLPTQRFSLGDRRILSICLRNRWEKESQKPKMVPLSSDDLNQMINNYRPLDPIEKLDNTLLTLEKHTAYVGHSIVVAIQNNFPLYHCIHEQELYSVLLLLCEEGYINAEDPKNPHNKLYISTKGYDRLRELRRTKDSRQCFVAMWMADEMNNAYEKAIRPGIEFLEKNETEPRFKALRIDNKEHTNDINDEIIGEIRRSRFMVCDLTGYRGGVYFEAGFAYGLGLEVIYTCREDWIRSELLRDETAKEISVLYDTNKRQISIRKEGIHFDLEHRNRIAWTEKDLETFASKLTNRIKAVVS